MEKIITRFPPSPTGFLHVGGARTALFNWLYARHTQGKFILRIEDTDLQRSTQASTDAIIEALEWLGIDWDEGPYFQSQRFDLYADYVNRLIDSGYAYYCTCSVEAVDNMRKQAIARGEKPKYDGTCREKNLGPSPDAVVRFKAPLFGETVINDIIKGRIAIPNSELDDFIIRRSDGTPTYNFVVVVDDLTMKINTIIRGDDHVNNTPKQIQLYQAFGAPLPTFGHVPMVLGKDRTRLSKRHGAMSVTAYRDMGYLPEALINYLVRLGWSYGDQEFFTRSELIEKFTLDNIGKSAGVFDPNKLLALNAEHIRRTPTADLLPYLMPFLKDYQADTTDPNRVQGIITTLHQRSKTLVEMAEGAQFYFADTIDYDPTAASKFLKPTIREALTLLIQNMEALNEFNEKTLESAFTAVMNTTGLKLGKIAQPVRVALTGKTVSPGIFEIINILGKTQTIRRLEQALEYIDNRTETVK